jgi:hypothetical protein
MENEAMSTANPSTPNGTDTTPWPLVEFWTKFIDQNAEQTQTLLNGFKEGCDPAALRRLWLDSLANSMDCYMRSPAFLESMRRNNEMMTHLKESADDVARDVARATGIPRINDISGLFERLQIGQEAILTRLKAIEDRLDSLENKRKRPHASS